MKHPYHDRFVATHQFFLTLLANWPSRVHASCSCACFLREMLPTKPWTGRARPSHRARCNQCRRQGAEAYSFECWHLPGFRHLGQPSVGYSPGRATRGIRMSSFSAANISPNPEPEFGEMRLLLTAFMYLQDRISRISETCSAHSPAAESLYVDCVHLLQPASSAVWL